MTRSVDTKPVTRIFLGALPSETENVCEAQMCTGSMAQICDFFLNSYYYSNIDIAIIRWGREVRVFYSPISLLAVCDSLASLNGTLVCSAGQVFSVCFASRLIPADFQLRKIEINT